MPRRFAPFSLATDEHYGLKNTSWGECLGDALIIVWRNQTCYKERVQGFVARTKIRGEAFRAWGFAGET